MKTPKQIALDIIKAHGDDPVTREDLRPVLIEAIEADRAQRPNAHAVMDDLLSAWEAYDGDVSGFYDAWANHLNKGTPVPDWARA